MVETYVLLSLRKPRPSVASAPFLSPVFPMWCSSSLITWEWPYLKNISIERGTGEIGLSTMHRHHIPHQHESKYQTDHPKYLAQKWRGVSLCRLHTLIEAPFSKRRLTTCDWTMDIVTVLVREETSVLPLLVAKSSGVRPQRSSKLNISCLPFSPSSSS